MTPPEHDAFGNPITESGGATASVPSPAAVEPSAPHRDRPAPSSRPLGPSSLRAWIAPVFTVLALAGLGLMLWTSERDALRSPGVADLRGVAGTRPGELPSARGAAGRSLVAPANLARALALVQRKGSRIVALRVAPERLDAIVRRAGGLRVVTVDAALRVRTTGSPGAGGPRGMRAGDVPAGGLARALRRIRAKAGIAPSRFDYAVLSPPSQSSLPPRWSIFYDDVPAARRTWMATLDGAKVRAR